MLRKIGTVAGFDVTERLIGVDRMRGCRSIRAPLLSEPTLDGKGRCLPAYWDVDRRRRKSNPGAFLRLVFGLHRAPKRRSLRIRLRVILGRTNHSGTLTLRLRE
jgi:hypothetical protein